MNLSVRTSAVFTRVCVAVIALSFILGAGSLTAGQHGRLKTGDPDGVGDLPFVGGPTEPASYGATFISTVGRVVDVQGVGVPDLSIVVTSANGLVVGIGTTDLDGLFILKLPVAGGMELAVLGTGVAEVPVEAGVPVLIVLP